MKLLGKVSRASDRSIEVFIVPVEFMFRVKTYTGYDSYSAPFVSMVRSA